MPDPAPIQSAAASPPLTLSEVHAVARLARLELPPERAELFRGQLATIVGYIDRLRTLNLEGVAPLASPHDRSVAASVVASQSPDTPGTTLSPEQALALAPDRFDQFFRVPRVLGEGSA